MSSSEPPVDNQYVIDIEEGSETARLIHQDTLYTEAIGGLFPEQPDLSSVRDIIDLACGPGGWALEVAFAHPNINVLGVDINKTMIDYAMAQAVVQDIQNVSFDVMNITQPLEIQNASFDLVNARFITGFMDRSSWPSLIKECYRILKPGGILRLTESEWGITNSVASTQLWGYFTRLLAKQGRTFSVDGSSMGIAHMLSGLLKSAGFGQVKTRAFLIDTSFASPLHYANYKNIEVSISLIKPFLLRSGTLQEAEFDELNQQMLVDMMQEDFAGITFGLTAWGTKPFEEQ